MGSIAHKDVSIIFQQLYEESPDKGEHGKKETGLKRIQNFTKLKKKSNSTAFKNIQLLLEWIQVFFYS